MGDSLTRGQRIAGVQQGVAKPFVDATLSRLNRGSDASLQNGRNILGKGDQALADQYGQDLSNKYGMAARKALEFIMRYPNRGGPGGNAGAWPSGNEFPTQSDLASVGIPEIEKAFAGSKPYDPSAAQSPMGGLKDLLGRVFGGGQ